MLMKLQLLNNSIIAYVAQIEFLCQCHVKLVKSNSLKSMMLFIKSNYFLLRISHNGI